MEDLLNKLDKRICDCEEGAENTQTYREFIRQTEEEFWIEHESIDKMSEKELKEYFLWLAELWGK
ncbi:hypothetical protein [Hathewaya massiliensis]|uniref:hypothetical protein n=1 Tax=Hathewaya massiliensis TaxID=1964382 RepID=UPI00115917B7|nr:hypothetical protein [Hathewaya massiliensis]